MGKKNRRRTTNNKTTKEPEDEELLELLASKERLLLQRLRQMEKSGLPIDRFVHHEHRLSVCDSLGLFQIFSHFGPPIPRPNAIAKGYTCFIIVICAHDSIAEADFHNTRFKAPEFFEEAKKDRRENMSAADPMEVPYSVCAGLIREALGRMEKRKAVLPGKMEDFVIRHYGLDTISIPTMFVPSDVLPVPSPAPDVDSLALLLCRPEYCSWYQLVDCRFEGILGYGPYEIPPSAVEVQRAMRKFSKRASNREKFYGMIRHMALWHALQKEFQVASWLLWELQALQDYSDEEGEEGAIERLESNILLQIAINLYFDCFENKGYWGNFFPEQGQMRGAFLTRYAIVSALASRGEITDGMVLTASVATSQERAHKTNDDHTDASASVSIHKACRRLKKTGCVVCGATTTKEGGELMHCSACKSKAYCSQECQRAHWKAGHKKVCVGNLMKKKGYPKGNVPVGSTDLGGSDE